MRSGKGKSSLKESPYLAFDSDTATFIKDRNDELYKATVEIKNKSAEYIAIKVKTNTPEHYIVRPNLLSLGPFTTKEITISCMYPNTAVSLCKSSREHQQQIRISF